MIIRTFVVEPTGAKPKVAQPISKPEEAQKPSVNTENTYKKRTKKSSSSPKTTKVEKPKFIDEEETKENTENLSEKLEEEKIED